MPTDVGHAGDAVDDDLKRQIEHQARELFSGRPEKGGASQIVRMIGRRADDVASRKLEIARERARAANKR